MLDRPLLGIMLMLGFCLLAPVGDAIAKLLGSHIPLVELLLTRFGIQVAVLVPLSIAISKPLWLYGRVLRLTALRAVLHIVGIGAMFTGLRFLPLADAVAIAFVMPFIMLILGHYILGEEVGPRRVAACAVGFVGTLLVIQPSFAAVGLNALWPLLVAVVFSLFMLVTRAVAKEADPITQQTVSGIIATGLLGLAFLLPGTQETDIFQLVWPEKFELGLMLTMGLLGTVAHLLMTWALRFAPSATLAPIQYLEIPISALVGLMIFSEFPNGLALIGICITIGSGLYILGRERRLARVAPPAA